MAEQIARLTDWVGGWWVLGLGSGSGSQGSSCHHAPACCLQSSIAIAYWSFFCCKVLRKRLKQWKTNVCSKFGVWSWSNLKRFVMIMRFLALHSHLNTSVPTNRPLALFLLRWMQLLICWNPLLIGSEQRDSLRNATTDALERASIYILDSVAVASWCNSKLGHSLLCAAHLRVGLQWGSQSRGILWII